MDSRSRERVRSTFLEDFRTFMAEKVPEERRTFDWHEPQHEPQHDPGGMYPVDCRGNELRAARLRHSPFG